MGNASIDQLSEDVFIGHGPMALVNADFDGDGKLDLAVVDASGATLRVYLGDGRGGFRPPISNAAEPARRNGPIPECLTARENEVANLLMRGFTDREIATMLGIGRRTVETHAANVRAKLRLKSRRELLRGIWPAVRAS
jgi:DNA-binding CsgD family transcriptional regulator